MLAVIIIIVQLVILCFIGGYIQRISESSFESIGINILFLLAWTLLYSPLKNLTLNSMIVLLLVSAGTFEVNMLFSPFWYQIFNGFSQQYQLTKKILIENMVAVFVVLLVCLDFVGIFKYWEIYMMIVLFVGFGWSFISALFRYVLKIFDGEGGMSVFLFSGVVTVVIWWIAVRGRYYYLLQTQIESQLSNNVSDGGGMKKNTGNGCFVYEKQQYYNGYSISLYGGIIGVFILWPKYNAICSILSYQIITVNKQISKQILFANSAYINTIFALCIGTLLSLTLLTRDGSTQNKGNIHYFFDCFINSGIVCASFAGISINPSAGMTMAGISTVFTLVYYLYRDLMYQRVSIAVSRHSAMFMLVYFICYFNRVFYRIVLPFIGVIASCVIIAMRKDSEYQLLDINRYGSDIYVKTAGLEFVGYFVVVAVGICVGVCCGVMVNILVRMKEKQLGEKQMGKGEEVGKMGREVLVEKKQSEEDGGKKQLKIVKKEKLVSDIINDVKKPKLSDVELFEELTYEVFPIFLQHEDKYNDEEQTARRELNKQILSHLKSNLNQSNNKNKTSQLNLNHNKKLSVYQNSNIDEQNNQQKQLKNLKAKRSQFIITKSKKCQPIPLFNQEYPNKSNYIVPMPKNYTDRLDYDINKKYCQSQINHQSTYPQTKATQSQYLPKQQNSQTQSHLPIPKPQNNTKKLQNLQKPKKPKKPSNSSHHQSTQPQPQEKPSQIKPISRRLQFQNQLIPKNNINNKVTLSQSSVMEQNQHYYNIHQQQKQLEGYQQNSG